MITVGVDLSAESDNTVVACLEWTAAGASLTDLILRADDDAIVDALLRADKAGIDCPLGWPDEFVDFVVAHRTGQAVAPEDVAGREWRRRLAYRRTDDDVRSRTGLVPLSVATNLLGLTAMRCSSLLARLAAVGRPVDRSGQGVVVEVYPAASLNRWGLRSQGYKKSANAHVLAQLVADLRQHAGWLDLNVHEDTCKQNDDAFDAVIAAITARAAATGMTFSPDESQKAAAATEGWIAIPSAPLSDLLQ
jgi:predicted nuclease with RNAse H fold